MSSNKDIELEALRSVGVREASSTVPGDVHTLQQLEDVPDEYLNLDHSGNCNKHRPLLHTDGNGNSYAYALNPLKYSVFLILVLELLERFSYYGLYMTQTNYLTGSYNADWNADMTSMDAASLISLSTAVVYTVPFISGMLADVFLGDYKTILVGVLFFYLPGLFIIASSTTPNWWLGMNSFNVGAYKVAMMLLLPVGAGTVKAVVNIFGARQYHPFLQKSMVESFYVQFYMVINVGAVVGCFTIPILARHSITAAYSIPFVLLLVAVLFFTAGSKRYVNVVPGHATSAEEEAGTADKEKASFSDVAKMLALIIPFNIAYIQCPTTFMVQGAVMEPFLGFIEAPTLTNLDSASVLVTGYFVSSYFYPFLAKKNIKLATGYKFALGSSIGACAILWSLFLEKMIHDEYDRTGGRVNVLWQAPSYILIGAGEIFSISTAYEVAFTASPPNKKVFACAFNLFCIGGLPNILSLGLYRICGQWFQNDNGSGNIGRIQDYSQAHVANYFWVLFGVVLFGVVINLLRPVRVWIARVEARAAKAASGAATSTPKVQRDKTSEEKKRETDPLLKDQKQMKYMEEGTEAHIYRMNTMKAEFSKRPTK
ncbi:hypothetical protein ACHAXR_007341 [Thalassiosira sp. AJA248-18]